MAMPLSWSDDPAMPLAEQMRFVDRAASTIVLGTGRFQAGQVMPTEGRSQYPMREISIILEGEIETECEGETFLLKAGDVVTIAPNQQQRSRFTKDTKLVYVFFGGAESDGAA